MNEKIFKAIKILDRETILLNAGTNDGIKNEDKFEIYSLGKEIIDPYTNDSLGTLDIIKEIVTVDTALEKMCVCRHHLPRTFSAFSPLKSLYTDGGYKNLNVDKTQMSNEIDADHTIRIGDNARIITPQISAND